jgi:hypothetical protein
MDAKEKELFGLIWSLVQKHQTLLGDALPVIHDIVLVLGQGLPTHTQLGAWKERYDEMSRRLYELNVDFELLREAVDPLFRYDS